MSKSFSGKILLALVALLFGSVYCAGTCAAQDEEYGGGGNAAKSEKSSKPTPRLSDGHPDLNGIWGGGGGGNNVFKKPDGSTLLLLPGRSDALDKDPNQLSGRLDQDPDAIAKRKADPNQPPYKPELMEKVKYYEQNENSTDPAFFCKPEGVPRMGPPAQIVQIPGQVVFLYASEKGNVFRVIPIDKPHQKDVDDLYLGDSVGHWDGDTLVVDAIGFTDDTWLGIDGFFHSTAMHVTEKLHRDGDVLHYQATVEDPNVFTRPWVMNPRTIRLDTKPDAAILENAPCVEKDESHIVNHDHH